MTATIGESKSILVARETLSTERRRAMFELMQRHFEGVSETQFRNDLEEKNWVLLIEKMGRLVGFTVLAIYESCFQGERILVVYSGDTIVAPEAWNSTALARGWIAAVNTLRPKGNQQKCFWLLLTSGFRTYRFLPVFWKEFYPTFNSPAVRPAMVDHLARERFGGQYLAENGIVRFPRPQRLAGELKTIPEGRLNDPHIACFIARNPGWASGDELVCLTELSEENLTRAGRRMLRD